MMLPVMIMLIWTYLFYAPAMATILPSEILNLTSWMLQLPVNSTGGMSGTYGSITQPALDSYVLHRYFFVNNESTAVEFVAPTRGLTTASSTNPRCELREMSENGKTMAYWTTYDGSIRTLSVQYTVWKVPAKYRTCTIAQIFAKVGKPFVALQYRAGAVVAVIYNYTTSTSQRFTLASPVSLGSNFTVKAVVTFHNLFVYYNDTLQLSLIDRVPTDKLCFKAGAYGQYAPDEAANDSSRIWIHSLSVRYEAPGPTVAPTARPTQMPTLSIRPSPPPSPSPSKKPTRYPSYSPAQAPTSQPTRQPTRQPTDQPSQLPAYTSGLAPTLSPLQAPTPQPTWRPLRQPTGQPTSQPSQLPTYASGSAPTFLAHTASSLDKGALIGGLVGSILGILVLITACVCSVRMRRARMQQALLARQSNIEDLIQSFSLSSSSAHGLLFGGSHRVPLSAGRQPHGGGGESYTRTRVHSTDDGVDGIVEIELSNLETAKKLATSYDIDQAGNGDDDQELLVVNSPFAQHIDLSASNYADSSVNGLDVSADSTGTLPERDGGQSLSFAPPTRGYR